MKKNIKDIVSAYSSEIVTCRNKNSMAIVIFLIGVSAITIILSIISVSDTYMSDLLILGGLLIMCLGIWLLIAKSTELRYKQTNSIVDIKQIYVSPTKLKDVMTAVENDCDRKLLTNNVSELYMIMLKSRDGQFCLLQINQFAEFDYKPVSEPFRISAETAESLLDACK